MATVDRKNGFDDLERRVSATGLVLVGFAIVVTAVSYISYSPFHIKWLVLAVGIAFLFVSVITIVSALGLRTYEWAPTGAFQQVLIWSIPLSFIISSQVCGLGIEACSAFCQVINIALIVLAVIAAIQLSRGKSIGLLLIVMIIFGLWPHCVCLAPINTIWHARFGGIAPTCEMIPLGATLFALSALRGVRPVLGTILVAVLMIVMVFIAVGGSLWGFPWQGCVHHP